MENQIGLTAEQIGALPETTYPETTYSEKPIDETVGSNATKATINPLDKLKNFLSSLVEVKDTPTQLEEGTENNTVGFVIIGVILLAGMLIVFYSLRKK